MTKTELAETLADEANLTKKKARQALDSLTDIITNRLTDDEAEKVTIRGFGTFDISHREEREGVDPQDHDKTIKIPARTVPQFRAGSQLKRAVRQAHSE